MNAVIVRQLENEMDKLRDNNTALRCLNLLLASLDSTPVTLMELSYLIEPIIEQNHAVLENVRTVIKLQS